MRDITKDNDAGKKCLLKRGQSERFFAFYYDVNRISLAKLLSTMLEYTFTIS